MGAFSSIDTRRDLEERVQRVAHTIAVRLSSGQIEPWDAEAQIVHLSQTIVRKVLEHPDWFTEKE